MGKVEPVSTVGWLPKRAIWGLVTALVFGSLVALLLQEQILDLASPRAVAHLGYAAVFLVSVIGSATVVIPLPTGFVTVVGGALLSPWLVGLVAGVGCALGELTGYVLGRSVPPTTHKRLHRSLQRLMQYHAGVVLLLLAVVPNPLFDIAGMWAGYLRLPLWRFLVIVGLGKTVKSTAFALVGAWMGHHWFWLVG